MTETVVARILDAAIMSLRTDILPQLPNDGTRIRFDQITRLLKGASARLSKREDGLKLLLQSAASLPGLASATSNAADPSIEDLERQRSSVEQTITERLPALLEEAMRSDEGIRALEKIITMEKNFLISQDPDIAGGSGVVYRGGRIDNEAPRRVTGEQWPVIDETSLTAYLRNRVGRQDIRATKVRTIPGGFSKQTIFFTQVDDATGASLDLVIRKDMPVPFIEKTVANEFALLQQLYGKGFPVAKALWIEQEHSIFGGRFIVSERVAGTSDSASWAADPVRARAACRELAQVLGRLHSFAPAELGYSADLARRSAGELMEREIDHWARLFHAKQSEPMPLQELPLVWLRRNIPRELYDRPARVVHGDVGFHNLMFDEKGRVTALLDWEFSILGDPSQDVGFVRQFVEHLIDWQEFLDLYLKAGGIAPCKEAEFFFDLWSKARNAIGCVDACSLFDTVMPDEVKFALAGHVFGPYLYIDECESLIAHLKKSRP